MERWKVYIGQANTAQENHYRIERLTRAYVDDASLFAHNRVFAQAWLKYAEHVEDKEDVYEFILAKQIGNKFCRTFNTIASYYETIKNFRRADSVYR